MCHICVCFYLKTAIPTFDFQDVDRIDAESKKVFRSLRYIQDVVDKNILQLLPGSATVVLETVMEVYQLLSTYFINQERWANSTHVI